MPKNPTATRAFPTTTAQRDPGPATAVDSKGKSSGSVSPGLDERKAENLQESRFADAIARGTWWFKKCGVS